jgi:hypothetical protein
MRTTIAFAFCALALGACGPKETTSTPTDTARPVAKTTTSGANARERTISIVGTNDLHGRLLALPILGGYVANLRRVRALDELLMLDLPPLAAGTTLTGELVLCDGDGVEQDIAGTTPLLVISRVTAEGPEILAIVSDFVQATTKKWTFSLPLLSEPLLTYLGQAGESKEAVFEVSQASAGLVRAGTPAFA